MALWFSPAPWASPSGRCAREEQGKARTCRTAIYRVVPLTQARLVLASGDRIQEITLAGQETRLSYSAVHDTATTRTVLLIG